MKLNRHVDMWAIRNNDDGGRMRLQYRYFLPVRGRQVLINNQGENGTWQIREIQNRIFIGDWYGNYPTLESAEQELEAEYTAFAA
jgi:hypothetical protein